MSHKPTLHAASPSLARRVSAADTAGGITLGQLTAATMHTQHTLNHARRAVPDTGGFVGQNTARSWTAAGQRRDLIDCVW